MLFAWPIIDGLPAHGFEIYCYSNHGRPDAVTERLRAQVAGWRDIHAIDDAAVAAQIVRDRIDVLVDLTGHTAGHRLSVFAYRPAPVQVTMIGHIGTTGVEAMDYRVTDVRAEPADGGRDNDPHHDRWYVEKLIRLPRTCWCIRPSAPSQPSRTSAGPNDVFTFGSFNNFAKLSDATLDLWTELLRSVPQSRMLFVTVPEGRTQARLRERFAHGGVDPSRIEMHGLVPEARYRALHAQVDVALDPFPCNGFVTTIETLWLGVPVVALEGDSFRSRNGASILANAGLDALVARSADEYLEIARGLAGDPDRLAWARTHTGEHLRTTALMDEVTFISELAGAFTDAWRAWLASQ
jgi:predicted O-linked N-acetylglucosamine transferase (SPINDLY family)